MNNDNICTIYLAGGCFWGIEAYFQQLKGVIDTEVGYANGDSENPKYEDLLEHRANHAETVKIVYDMSLIPLSKILEHYLRIVDPYAMNRQGNDVGIQYRSGVYYVNEADREVVLAFFAANYPRPERRFAIEVKPLKNFYKAEDYHQDYLIKNPFGYCHVEMRKIKKEERK
ncbi:MAG: peptide-methionine (S)-S-oxide reductase MsrA [Bacilli bacterium]|nr:peptide-methionine (S)-S-oxide reductase MsrA [Bacilli bacterium]